MEQSDSGILSLCSWMLWALLLPRPFNCLIQITRHHRAESAQGHLLIICPTPVHTSHPSSPGIWLPLVVLCLAPIHSRLLSLSISLVRAHFSHFCPPLVELTFSPAYYIFNLKLRTFLSLLHLHHITAFIVYCLPFSCPHFSHFFFWQAGHLGPIQCCCGQNNVQQHHEPMSGSFLSVMLFL